MTIYLEKKKIDVKALSQIKNIKNVTIEPGCVSCGCCESVCSDVFELKETARVKQGADFKRNVELIYQAASMCPVKVIKIEEN